MPALKIHAFNSFFKKNFGIFPHFPLRAMFGKSAKFQGQTTLSYNGLKPQPRVCTPKSIKLYVKYT